MEKILVIGCPGSGKSYLSRELKLIFDYPILHLDYIYHIDNEHQISKEELREKIKEFVESNQQFIIDGNYTGTLEYRLQYADTVILYMIDTDICINNAIKRMKEPRRNDMAPGFDNSVMDDDFLEYIKRFNIELLPRIEEILRDNPDKHIIRLRSYEEKEQFLESLR